MLTSTSSRCPPHGTTFTRRVGRAWTREDSTPQERGRRPQSWSSRSAPAAAAHRRRQDWPRGLGSRTG
ncbi:hypothetical protein [Ornithinimicrobium kibberense]|uniref:hypothetical protein n=1 Tax=Ornithinimicrobium kibberense TaxID=282060 RepID=UPI0036103720